MPLFEFTDDAPQPYKLRYHRSEAYTGVPPLFWIRPMVARETQRYFTRRDGDPALRRQSVDKQADATSDLDFEVLRSVFNKAEHIYKDGDVVEGPDAIGVLVEKLDWGVVQELLGAASSRTTLADGAKNS